MIELTLCLWVGAGGFGHPDVGAILPAGLHPAGTLLQACQAVDQSPMVFARPDLGCHPVQLHVPLAINAAGANCEYDTEGNCIRARLCEGDGDCLAEHEPRAWSSPIYVDYSPAL